MALVPNAFNFYSSKSAIAKAEMTYEYLMNYCNEVNTTKRLI